MATAPSTPPQSDRAETNRANAAHSTGPRTADGKQKVRLNALRHGLFSSEIILPGEDREAYERLGHMLLQAYKPANGYERDLLQTIHDTDWQLKRIRSLESSALALGLQREIENVDPDLEPAIRQAFAAAIAYEKNQRLFDQFSRHSGRLTRLRDNTRRELIEFQIDRMKRARENPAAKPATAKAPPTRSGNAPRPTGFVPTEPLRKACADMLGRESVTDDEFYEFVGSL